MGGGRSKADLPWPNIITVHFTLSCYGLHVCGPLPSSSCVETPVPSEIVLGGETQVQVASPGQGSYEGLGSLLRIWRDPS